MSAFDVLYPPAATERDVLEALQNTARTQARDVIERGEKFCAILSDALLTHGRQFVELQALGFWLRRSSVHAMRETLAHKEAQPVGTVFLVLPSNVPVMLGYGVALALLCGNRVCVRLSRARSETLNLLLTHIAHAADEAGLSDRLCLVRYGHDDAVTAQFSALADVRLVWGGDATVAHFQSFPVKTGGHSIGFGDRFSMCAVNLSRYAACSEQDRETCTDLLARDITLFDQFACSSPRLCVLVGSADLYETLRKDLFKSLHAAATRKGNNIGPGESVARQNAAFGIMAEGGVARMVAYGPSLVTLELKGSNSITGLRERAFGYGLLPVLGFKNLADLAGVVTKKDQTLAHWGFESEDLDDFSRVVSERGLDRIVPMGQALAFDAVWDGHNLFHVLSR